MSEQNNIADDEMKNTFTNVITMPERDTTPIDRLSPRLRELVEHIPVDVIDPKGNTSDQSILPYMGGVDIPGLPPERWDDYLTQEEIAQYLANPETDGILRAAIAEGGERARSLIEKKAIQDGWLGHFDDESYEANPARVDGDPQKYVFDQAGEQLPLYNYGEALQPEVMDIITRCVDTMQQLTGGKMLSICKAIVISNHFAPRSYAGVPEKRPPGGQADLGRRIVSLNGDQLAHLSTMLHKLRAETDIAKQQEYEEDVARLTEAVESLVVHELAHLIDAAVSVDGLGGSFGEHFEYPGQDQALDHTIQPKPASFVEDFPSLTFEDVFCGLADKAEVIGESKPTSEYGYTDAHEDYATSFESYVLGPSRFMPKGLKGEDGLQHIRGELDPLRREAIDASLAQIAGGPVTTPVDYQPVTTTEVELDPGEIPGIAVDRLPSAIKLLLRFNVPEDNNYPQQPMTVTR